MILFLLLMMMQIVMATQKSRARSRWDDNDYHRRKYRSLGTWGHTLYYHVLHMGFYIRI